MAIHTDPSLEAFCTFYNKLDRTCTKKLYEVYTPDIEFHDPIHRISGLDSLEAYFNGLYENVTACRFEFHDQQRHADLAFVTWTMYLTHPRLAGGRQISVEGCSRPTFAADGSGKVCCHRDYFDAGELLYEHLPLLGPVIRRIKRAAE